jgi:hypothetical protein
VAYVRPKRRREWWAHVPALAPASRHDATSSRIDMKVFIEKLRENDCIKM